MKDRKKKKEGAQKKGGENSPISPPLDPRLRSKWLMVGRRAGVQLLDCGPLDNIQI